MRIDQARRIALAAQGVARPRAERRIDARQVRAVVARQRLLQIDSVNVLARAHYLPLFSRLGPYDPGILDRLAYRDRELYESWAHQASLVPVAHQPLLRWRSAEHAARWPFDDRALLEKVYAEVAERGPISAAELSEPGRRTGPWWGRPEGKRALDALFWYGRVCALRRPSFERVYDLPERVLPAAVLAAPTPPEREAKRELLRLAAGALGIGTVTDLADYYRLLPTDCRPLLDELVAAGELDRVTVDGWRQPAYLDPAAVVPRRAEGRALLSPFDPVVWCRDRTERLFGFHYRIGIYTPEHLRTHGYYALPFLVGDTLAGRVDLKADRKAGVLRVQGVWWEDRPYDGELRAELDLVARWLGLGEVM